MACDWIDRTICVNGGFTHMEISPTHDSKTNHIYLIQNCLTDCCNSATKITTTA